MWWGKTRFRRFWWVVFQCIQECIYGIQQVRYLIYYILMQWTIKVCPISIISHLICLRERIFFKDIINTYVRIWMKIADGAGKATYSFSLSYPHRRSQNTFNEESKKPDVFSMNTKCTCALFLTLSTCWWMSTFLMRQPKDLTFFRSFFYFFIFILIEWFYYLICSAWRRNAHYDDSLIMQILLSISIPPLPNIWYCLTSVFGDFFNTSKFNAIMSTSFTQKQRYLYQSNVQSLRACFASLHVFT